MVRIDQRHRVGGIVPAAMDRVHWFLGHRRA
jgi:hypothetical protein